MNWPLIGQIKQKGTKQSLSIDWLAFLYTLLCKKHSSCQIRLKSINSIKIDSCSSFANVDQECQRNANNNQND